MISPHLWTLCSLMLIHCLHYKYWCSKALRDIEIVLVIKPLQWLPELPWCHRDISAGYIRRQKLLCLQPIELFRSWSSGRHPVALQSQPEWPIVKYDRSCIAATSEVSDALISAKLVPFRCCWMVIAGKDQWWWAQVTPHCPRERYLLLYIFSKMVCLLVLYAFRCLLRYHHSTWHKAFQGGDDSLSKRLDTGHHFDPRWQIGTWPGHDFPWFLAWQIKIHILHYPFKKSHVVFLFCFRIFPGRALLASTVIVKAVDYIALPLTQGWKDALTFTLNVWYKKTLHSFHGEANSWA